MTTVDVYVKYGPNGLMWKLGAAGTWSAVEGAHMEATRTKPDMEVWIHADPQTPSICFELGDSSERLQLPARILNAENEAITFHYATAQTRASARGTISTGYVYIGRAKPTP